MQVQSKKVYYRGKALVVGNDHYDQVMPDLDNAVNDAKGIYEAFKDFETDAEKQQLLDIVKEILTPQV